MAIQLPIMNPEQTPTLLSDNKIAANLLEAFTMWPEVWL